MSGDERLVDLSVKQLGLTDAKTVSTPAVNTVVDETPALDPTQHALYRTNTGRAMYIASDRLDVQYACKTLARRLQDPTQNCLISLKRCFRFLDGHKKLRYVFNNHLQDFQSITVYVDSDWAGCRLTRRSTSGGIVCLGGQLSSCSILASYSRTQSSIALSTCEAELQSIVSGVGEGLFVQSLLVEMNFAKPSLTICTDSKAAYDGLRKLGVGRIKHVALRSLYVQELVTKGVVVLRKIGTVNNPADILTKPVSASVFYHLLSLLPVECVSWPTNRKEDEVDDV